LEILQRLYELFDRSLDLGLRIVGLIFAIEQIKKIKKERNADESKKRSRK